MKRRRSSIARPTAAALAFFFGGCGSGDAGSPESAKPATTGSQADAKGAAGQSSKVGGAADDCTKFDSTFAAIQKVIFEAHGCTAQTCHGQAKTGEMDLRSDAAYKNLFDVKSTGSALQRVLPGSARESYLYLKLQAATMPGSVQIAGSPMPVGRPALSDDELSVVQSWIAGGAPEKGAVANPTTGTSGDIGTKLSACLPKATPVEIQPLAPPPADEGIQFQMPVYLLKAGSERESCMAFYYDFTDKVPDRFKDDTGEFFYVNGSRVRQDPNSHHFVYIDPGLGADSVTDPAFGTWTCYDGLREGMECDPLDQSGCGSGVCGSKQVDGFVCSGFGPKIKGGGLFGGIGNMVINAQAAQQYLPPIDGAFKKVRLKGLFYFNTHAFNLTDQDMRLHARLNVYYTDDLRYLFAQSLGDGGGGFAGAPKTPPFQTETVCATLIAQQNSRLADLSGHTHKHGKHFWVTDSNGEMIYENFIYSEPLYKTFDPPMLFDSPNQVDRSLKYCATYNNGLNDDGTANTELVTRLSKMDPKKSSCTAVACVEGKVGAPCSQDSDCDSKGGDGWCDACPITPGDTTENEMFILLPYFLTPVAN